METVKDVLISGGVLIFLSIGTSILAAWIKKGQIQTWGETIGKWISKFGNLEFGKSKWEKIEDVVTLAILSFAKGIKIGADSDDDGKLKRIEHYLNTGGKVGDKTE